jgi:hypothetical protein
MAASRRGTASLAAGPIAPRAKPDRMRMPPVSVWKAWISAGTACRGSRLGFGSHQGQRVGGDDANGVVVGGHAGDQGSDSLVGLFPAQIFGCLGDPITQRFAGNDGLVGFGYNVVRWLGDRRLRVGQHECENTANHHYKP